MVTDTGSMCYSAQNMHAVVINYCKYCKVSTCDSFVCVDQDLGVERGGGGEGRGGSLTRFISPTAVADS